MKEQKKVLIPGGSVSDWALINAAHRLGLYAITSGTNESAPAHKFSDEYVYADYSDKDAILRVAKEKNVDFMVSNAHDFGMLSTAYVCEQLGLPGHDSYETTYILHHKDTFKTLAKKLGIHSPVSEIFDDRNRAIEFLKKSDVQMIIKPSDNAASYGVSTPKTPDDYERCVDDAFNNSKSKRIIIEPFIVGFPTTAAAIIINQKVEYFCADSYHVYPEGEANSQSFTQYKRCTGFLRPGLYFDEYADSIVNDINKIAKELQLADGNFHCELMITPKHEAFIFDLHRRTSGSATPWSEWVLPTGLQWEDWTLKAECGMDISDFKQYLPKQKYYHIRNVYAPRNGIIKKVTFDKYLTSHMYPNPECEELKFYNIYVTDHIHQPIIDITTKPGGTGRFFFAFDTKEEANAIGNPENNDFYSHIKFEYYE